MPFAEERPEKAFAVWLAVSTFARTFAWDDMSRFWRRLSTGELVHAEEAIAFASDLLSAALHDDPIPFEFRCALAPIKRPSYRRYEEVCLTRAQLHECTSWEEVDARLAEIVQHGRPFKPPLLLPAHVHGLREAAGSLQTVRRAVVFASGNPALRYDRTTATDAPTAFDPLVWLMAQGSENPEDVIGKAALYDAFLAAAPPGLAMRRGPFHVLAAEHFTERNINRGNGSRRYYVGIKLRSNECLTAPYVTGSLFGSATASPSPMAPGTSAEAISTRGAA